MGAPPATNRSSIAGALDCTRARSGRSKTTPLLGAKTTFAYVCTRRDLPVLLPLLILTPYLLNFLPIHWWYRDPLRIRRRSFPQHAPQSRHLSHPSVASEERRHAFGHTCDTLYAIDRNGIRAADMDAHEEEPPGGLCAPLVLHQHSSLLGAYHICTPPRARPSIILTRVCRCSS
jgi:hypothetical protein